MRMAQVLLRDNRPVEAEKAFRDVLKDDPKNPEISDGLGVALLMQARYKEALAPLQKAVQLAPQNGSYRNNLGVAQMELGDFAGAEAAFRVAEESPNADDRLSALDQLGPAPHAPGTRQGGRGDIQPGARPRPAVLRRDARPRRRARGAGRAGRRGRGLPGRRQAAADPARRRTCVSGSVSSR